MPFLASEACFWPLKASMTSEVKNNHAHVTTQTILNKFIGMKFSIGCMVWPRCCLFQDSTTMSPIYKIPKSPKLSTKMQTRKVEK